MVTKRHQNTILNIRSSRVQKTNIIAEVGVNHNGDLDLAFKLIDAAYYSGADSVKFQTFDSKKIVTKGADKAKYQQSSGGSETQQQMLERLQLSHDDHHKLIAHCNSRAIKFISSAFDLDSLCFLLDDLKLDTIKFGSGELLNAPLLYEAAKRKADIIISTGMATIADIEQALSVLALGMADITPDAPTVLQFSEAWSNPDLRARVKDRVKILHCTSSYPTPASEANLYAMNTIGRCFGIPVGYSDHTESDEVTLAAVALGAEVIEKHLTLDRSMDGPDHAASMEPEPFKVMVEKIREIEKALGLSVKVPADIERPIAKIARKSLVAKCSIKTGDIFSADNLTIKRPGTGISPMYYYEMLGLSAQRDYEPDELIER